MRIVKFGESEEYHAPGQPLRRAKIFASPETTGTKGLTVGMTLVAPGEKGALHTHKGEETMFVVHGTGKFFTKEGEFIVGPYTLVYIPPGEEHGYENVSTTQTLEFIWIYTPPGEEKPLREKWIKVK